MYTQSTMEENKSWDEMRKEIRRLENEVDEKLVALTKVDFSAGGSSSSSSFATSDTAPLLGDGVFTSLFAEVKDLITELTAMNDSLYEHALATKAAQHTRQRHRDILRGYRQEFAKIEENHRMRVERESLLEDGGLGGGSGGGGSASHSGLSRRDMYLKENQHVQNSHSLINDQISIAMETREHLESQRQNLRRMHGRFNDMAHRFPVINSLVQRITIRKRRDSLILGTVIAVCTILTILYLIH